MSGDLGMQGGEVHENARAVLRFWFDEVGEARWFAKDDALDREIADRFGALRDAVLAGGAKGWSDDARTVLAAIILLDQFSRNIHRGTSDAFAADPLARSLTALVMKRRWDGGMTGDERQFVYMPLMHAEDWATQQESLAAFAALGNARNLEFARDHAAVIDRFGRFPSRNVALSRASTPEEERYLSQPVAGW